MNLKPIALLLLLLLANPLLGQDFQFNYEPSPLDNPVRGLVPYAAQMPWLDPNASEEERKEYFKAYDAEVFPHSIEFHYFSMRELVPQEGKVDFDPIEKWLQQTTSRGSQLTFRVYLEYPSNPDRGAAFPQYLVDQGLKVTKWRNDDDQFIHTPDYDNPNLRKAIDVLIQKLGEKYDGDPRVACLSMGVLGQWGEWHSCPREKLFPGKDYQSHVMDQFEKAFQKTPVLMRYASGEDDWSQAPNANRTFGFHDDSFAWATIDTGKEDDSWFFLAKMKEAGSLDAWKTRMIGGEVRPEIWGCVFDDDSCEVKGQEFDRCVDESHATWLMDSGMFGEKGKPSAARIRNAKKKVGRMGYEFHVPTASVKSADGKTEVDIKIENLGVAPFYRNWNVEVAILDTAGNVRESSSADWELPSIMPGKCSRKATLGSQLAVGEVVAIRIPNPMENGNPIRFANANQQVEKDGWLILK